MSSKARKWKFMKTVDTSPGQKCTGLLSHVPTTGVFDTCASNCVLYKEWHEYLCCFHSWFILTLHYWMFCCVLTEWYLFGLFGNIPAQSNESYHYKWINIGDFCDLRHIRWQLVENVQVASICVSALCPLCGKYPEVTNVCPTCLLWESILAQTLYFMWKSHRRTQQSCHSKQYHVVYSCCSLLHVSAWRWPGHSWNSTAGHQPESIETIFGTFRVMRFLVFWHVTPLQVPEDGNYQISCSVVTFLDDFVHIRCFIILHELFVQGDQKVCVHLMITKLQVMFKVSLTSLQTFIDTRNCVHKNHVQYSTVHIPNVIETV
jgi:hypothetical protein